MDLLTHILVAYLVTIGIVGYQPSYVAAGALAGGLPDADALFFPIARRFPLLRHRGITHSFVGITIIAAGGAIFAPLIVPGSPWVYFLVMWVGGLSHIAFDGFTNFSVAPLLPFSSKELHLDAERAVNLSMLIFSIVWFTVLLGVERNHVAFSIYQATVWGLSAFFVAYFAIRLAGRYEAGRRARTLGTPSAVVPTENPFIWILIREEVADGVGRTTWARYWWGRGIVDGPHTVQAPIEVPPHTGSPTSADEALNWSYGLARQRGRSIASTYHFGEAFRSDAGEWVAVWYSLEYTAFGRASGVRVRFPAGGAPPEVKGTFYRPRLRAI